MDGLKFHPIHMDRPGFQEQVLLQAYLNSRLLNPFFSFIRKSAYAVTSETKYKAKSLIKLKERLSTNHLKYKLDYKL